uniref:transposase n=1 Tax=Streptomyces rhizosphaerihabitans TaxID=1266770 RepID=UPI0028F732F9|nr:transposase [Streptomyces rhizosphaerihabitans]
MAALICIKAGRTSRLIYRIHLDRGPAKGRRKGFTETDYARLLDAAHQQLGGPIILVWDNLNTHVSHSMGELTAARLWLTVYQLPPYAPEFNPVEGVWSHLKRSLVNLQTQPRPAHRAGEDPAQTDAVPTRTHRRPHRQDRPRLPTAVTPGAMRSQAVSRSMAVACGA